MFMFFSFSFAQRQVGRATYYANKFHGRHTSSGVVYYRDSFTCAHRYLPFGTIVKVRDRKTGKEVYVKVTDRLAGHATIDLSYAAAKELGILGRGCASVEITKCEDLTRVPYKGKDYNLPQLQVLDPLGNGYCLLSQWGERYNRKKLNEAMALNDKIKKAKAKAVAVKKIKPDSVPRWKILGKLTAQDNTSYPADHQMIIVK